MPLTNWESQWPENLHFQLSVSMCFFLTMNRHYKCPKNIYKIHTPNFLAPLPPPHTWNLNLLDLEWRLRIIVLCPVGTFKVCKPNSYSLISISIELHSYISVPLLTWWVWCFFSHNFDLYTFWSFCYAYEGANRHRHIWVISSVWLLLSRKQDYNSGTEGTMRFEYLSKWKLYTIYWGNEYGEE